jgi:hypothetical protein
MKRPSEILRRQKTIRLLQQEIGLLQAEIDDLEAIEKAQAVKVKEVLAATEGNFCAVVLTYDDRGKPVCCDKPAWRTGFAQYLRYGLSGGELMCPHHADLTVPQIRAEGRRYLTVECKTRAEILRVRDGEAA